jgi:hypothetical protein
MLSSEASQRLAAGETEQAILASHRPVARTARHLRRSVLRNAPLRRFCWGALTWIKRSIATSILVTLITYPYLFWRFHAPEPKPSRNLGAEYNARVDAIPIEDRAAELYQRVRAAFEPLDERANAEFAKAWPSIRPGEELWPEACAYIDRNEEAIALVREAAAKPFAGYRLSTAPPIDPAAGELDPDDTWNGNPCWMALAMEPLGEYRNLTRILAADARYAAQRAEPHRVCADILTILGLARHAEEGRSVIGDLVGIAVRVVAFDLIGELAAADRQVFETTHLTQLADAVATTIAPNVPKVDLEIERLQQFDYAQRVFTDDGNGDGHVCYSGIRFMRALAGEPEHDPAAFVLGPLNAFRFATRKEYLDEVDRMCAAIERDMIPPMWEWSDVPGAAFLRQREAVSGRPVLLELPLILGPSLAKAATTHEHMVQSRDAAVVMLSLARFRLDHGRYPQSLDSLVPAYLRQIPPDRFDGKPIKYRLTEAGVPLLYSVGSNRADDGGVPREGDRDGTKAMKWIPPAEAHLVAPGDWIILPRPRPEPYTSDD